MGHAATSALAALGTQHRGVWTRRQALTVTSAGTVDSLVRRGIWQVVWPGVLADAGIALDAGQRAHAAVLASGGDRPPAGAGDRWTAVTSGRTAARLHRLPLIDDRDPATGAQEHLLDDVATPRPGRPLVHRDHDGQTRVLHRHVRRFDRSELVRTASGLWLTSVLQTLLDCADVLSFDALVCALDHALHARLVDQGELAAAVEARAWQPGVVRLRAAVRVADGRAESPAETLTRLALLPTMPAFVPQHRLLGPGGRILARFDLADEALRLAVEADGKAGHAGPMMVAKDRQRDRVTEEHGWRTERVTWWELRRRRDAFVRRVQQVADERRRRR